MKKTQVFSIVLTLIFMAPLLSSMTLVNGPIDDIEVTETSQEKEQREKETKEEIDENEKFPILNQNLSTLEGYKKSAFSMHLFSIKDLHSEVLTPPPDIA